MSDALGRSVTFQQVTSDQLREQVSSYGLSDAMAQGMVDMMVAKDEGVDNVAARRPDVSTSTTFQQWCEDTLKPAVVG